MKMSISFTADEREKIEMVARLVRSLFPIERTHEPKMKDGLFHFYMRSVKD